MFQSSRPYIGAGVDGSHWITRLPPAIRSTPIYGHSEGSSCPGVISLDVTGCITGFGSSLIISIHCFPPVFGYRLPNAIATIYRGPCIWVIGFPQFLICEQFNTDCGLLPFSPLMVTYQENLCMIQCDRYWHSRKLSRFDS